MLFLEAEWKARDGNLICTPFFIQASEKLPTHLDWALPWQQGGFFCLTGFGLVAFWFVGFFFLLYRLHPDHFGICGNHKVVDARGRIASSEVGEWSDTFK